MPSHKYVRSAEYPLRVNNVAKRLKVSVRTVRYWIRSGKLPAIRNGPKLYCCNEADVERFRRERYSEP